MAVKVFVDFDGTVTRNDVGNEFFRKYCGHERYDELLRQYKSDEISAKECFQRGIAAVGRLDRNDAATFVRSQAIDSSFREFVAFCHSNGIEFHIVSDGLDFYIGEILRANDIRGVSVFANMLEFTAVDDSGVQGLRISFPHADAECRRCACCKRNIMLTNAGDEDVLVYVGEGYSDRCPATYADIVFAKDMLQTFCQENNISYHLYASFHDVVVRLNELLAKKKLRKRRAAELKRKELFMCEP